MNSAPPCSIPRRNVSALLLGAGAGERLGGKPKAFLKFGARTLLEQAIDLVRSFADEILIAVTESRLADAMSLAKNTPGAVCLAGGHSRQETLRLLLARATRKFVIEHEIARPFAKKQQLADVLAAADEYGTGIGGSRPLHRTTSALTGDDPDTIAFVIPRRNMIQLAAPHAYRRELLGQAMAKAADEGYEGENTADLLLRAGILCHRCASPPENIKITYPEDLELLCVFRGSSDTHSDSYRTVIPK